MAAQQRPRSGRPRPGRARRRTDRRPAFVLGRARHAVGAALERAQHRPERRCAACSARRRIRRRRRRARGRSARTPRVLWVLLPLADPARRPRSGSDLVRRRPGGVHADAADPVQPHPAGRLADRARAHRGRRARLRGEPRRRAAVLAARSGRRARPGARRGLRRQCALPGRARSSSAWLAATRPPATGRPRPTRRARGRRASRRLDDTFRSYLAERGAKPVPLAEVTGLVTGVAGAAPRRRRRAGSVAARRRAPAVTGPPPARELLATSRAHARLVRRPRGAASRDADGSPRPSPHDEMADGRLVDAVRHDLSPRTATPPRRPYG